MSTDFLVALTSQGRRLAKLWKADGKIVGYDHAKTFYEKIVPIANIRELSAFLQSIVKQQDVGVIRGEPDEPVVGRLVFRRNERYHDCKHHWIMFDVDGYRPMFQDPIADPEASIAEYIREALPSAFHDVSYIWHLSGSHGHKKNVGLLKVHLWFWLAEAKTSNSLNAWVNADNIPADERVFQQIQWNYTANPVMDVGVVDPVETRFGFVEGLMGDDVVLTIPDVDPGEGRKNAGVDDGDPDDDPVCQYLDEEGWTQTADHRTGKRHIRCPFESEHSDGGTTGDTSTTYLPEKTKGHALGHFKCHHTHCSHRTDDDFLDAIGYKEVSAKADFPIIVPPKDELPLPPYKRDSKGRIEATLDNIIKALRDGRWSQAHIALDTFKDEICLRRGDEWFRMQDHMYSMLRIALEQHGFKPVGKEMMRDAVELLAKQQEFDSAQVWLESLEWDGIRRVDTFFSEYFGADDTDYVRAVGRYAWTALAGRVLVPGIKADMVPILEGDQGIRKTSAVEAIAPNIDNFVEINLEEKPDDLARKMRGALVGEIAELHGLHTRELEYIKAFITRRHERWVPKFREFSTLFPRRLVFFGTTNKDEILADETGNRRWLPLHVEKADAERIAADRDQLWAEAKLLFEHIGIAWQGLDELADHVRTKYAIHDVWEDQISAWLESASLFDTISNGDQPFRLETLAAEVFNIPAKGLDRLVTGRLAKALKKLGYERKTSRHFGSPCKVWQKRTEMQKKTPGVVIPYPVKLQKIADSRLGYSCNSQVIRMGNKKVLEKQGE